MLSFAIIIALFGIENASKYFFGSLIPESFIYYLPSTNLKKKLVKEFNMRSDSIITIESDTVSQNLYLPKYSFYSPSDSEDKNFGATELRFYNDGFCNETIHENYENAIASFGDSFTYCTAVNPKNAWPKLLKIDQKIPYVNLNFGVQGTGPWEYYNLLKSKINERIKIIVVAIYEGNDLRDSFSPSQVLQAKKKKSKKSIKSYLEISTYQI